MIDVMRSILAILCSKKRIKKYEKKRKKKKRIKKCKKKKETEVGRG